MLAALVFVALARFGRFALGALDRLALLADLRFFLGDLAFLGLAHLGVAERVGAPALLFLGQRAQHHAGGLRRWRSGCRRGWRRWRWRRTARDNTDTTRRRDGSRRRSLGLSLARPARLRLAALDRCFMGLARRLQQAFQQ